MKQKQIYKIDGMHCSSCAMLIEGELEDRGVLGRCSFAKGELEVETNRDDSVDALVKESVEAAGYRLKQ